MRRSIAAYAGVFALVVVASCPGATPEQVESAIKRGVEWLFARQKDNGTWEEVMQPDGPDWDVKGRQWGGLTAIATYALLASGQSPQNEKLLRPIAFLKQAEIVGTYALAMRCQVWSLLPQSPENRALFARDARLLASGAKTEGASRGLFNYWADGPGGRYDHSCANFGVLGLWACAEANIEFPLGMWVAFDEAWRRHQYEDGSWSYIFAGGERESRSTLSMTSAGVATLFITQDYTRPNMGLNCEGTPVDMNLLMGMRWMAANFSRFREHYTHYTLYNIERVGVASGHKYIGDINWYDVGADYLVRTQRDDGGWGDIPSTCFSILFLVRGRAPVVFGKLEYYPPQRPGARPAPSTWNNRPRDIANITRWIGRQIERDLNWQIVNLKAPVEELHDAPVLFIGGSEPLVLSAEDQAKLKLYIEQGGLVLGHADCGRKVFADSFRKLASAMFPDYEMRELPAQHPIYTGQQFSRSRWKSPPSVLGLSNGARELMLLIPAADPGRGWQVRSFEGQERGPLAELAANIVQYAVDKKNLRFKGERPTLARDAKIKPFRTIRIARLQYAGIWDPEPEGWRRLPIIMHNNYAVTLQVQTIRLGTGALSNQFAAAHITGTGALRLDQRQREELKAFIDGGGTLIIDACGGQGDFAISAAALINDMYPGRPIATPTVAHPMYSVVAPGITSVAYRQFTTRLVGRSTAPRIRALDVGGRTGVFLSPEDLSVGLVGQPIDGIVGYEPQSAALLMSHMILYAAGVRLSAEDIDSIRSTGQPATRPATQPTGAPSTRPAKQPA